MGEGLSGIGNSAISAIGGGGGSGGGDPISGIGMTAYDDIYGQIQSAQGQAFASGQAQQARGWEQYMSDTSYQRAVAGMKAAGINPAMAFSNGPLSVPGAPMGSSPMITPANSALDTQVKSQQVDNLQKQNELMGAQASATSNSALETKARTDVINATLRTIQQQGKIDAAHPVVKWILNNVMGHVGTTAAGAAAIAGAL